MRKSKDFSYEDIKDCSYLIPFIIIGSVILLLLGLPLISLAIIASYILIGIVITFFTYDAGGVPPSFFIFLWPLIILIIPVSFIANKFYG